METDHAGYDYYAVVYNELISERWNVHRDPTPSA